MPHFIIEYSKDLKSELDPLALLRSVYDSALESSLFSEDDIKVRAIAFEHYCVGRSRQNFVHVTIRMLSGRNLEQRTSLSDLILVKLNQMLSGSISVTVEVSEIEKASYAKNITSV